MEIPFDAILTLLVFLVGIPALVLQLISASERRAVMKKGRLDVIYFLKRALVVIGVGIIIEVAFIYSSKPNEDSLKRLYEQMIWLGIFGALFYLAWLVAKRIPEQYGRREKIIEKLTQEALNESLEKVRVAGGVFADLASLGKHCDPGQEREMVIHAFKEIVIRILISSKYQGDSFEVLIDDLVHMLVSNPEPKDLYNYDSSIKILSAILSAGKDLKTNYDQRQTLHAISNLGRTLIVSFKSVEKDSIILNCIDALELALSNKTMLTEVSQALFEIGVCAVNEDQDFIAVATLNKMTSLAEHYLPLPDEFVADLFGLLAHYWVKQGSRKEFAVRKFEEVKTLLPKNIIPVLQQAQEHLIKTMYFDEADKLGQIIINVAPR